MKQGKWEKKKFLGEEVREKTLGLAGLGRIGQEVARRAAAFGMRIIAHDPFISEQVAADLGVELVSLDDLFARADYVSLHMPSNDKTRNLVNAERLARARRRASASSTPRAATSSTRRRWPTPSKPATWAAPRSTSSRRSRPSIQRLQMLPQVVATPHIAASTREGQELVGVETAAALRDFLRDGIIRNAVNFPSVSAEEFSRLRPFIELGERLGAFLAQMNDSRAHELGVRYYGELADGRNDMIVNAVLVGLFKPILVVGRDAGQRAQRGQRPRHRDRRVAQLPAAELHEPALGEAAYERRRAMGRRRGLRADVPARRAGRRRRRRGAARRHDDRHPQQRSAGRHRRGRNDPRPPRRQHRQLRARPRGDQRAVGVVIVDETSPIPEAVLTDIRKVKAIREARIVRV